MSFIQVNDEWYTPFWYHPVSKEKKCNFDYYTGKLCKLFANYYGGQIKNHIAEVRFIDKYSDPVTKYGEYIRFIASLRVLGFSPQEVLKIIGNKPQSKVGSFIIPYEIPRRSMS